MTTVSKKILVVDDEDAIREILKIKLVKLGYDPIQIKERNPETVIYAFSGHVTEDEFDQLEKMGFDGLLCKPLTFEVLERAIEGAFDKINNREKLSTPLCSS
ncbi:MAG: hypothetical protein JRJ39_12835 [Deltaproteobacteria bacterium]|nr:hypothetical protein [Deltaproteobacteria bacterium]